MKRVVLDTNAYTAFLAGKDAVLDVLASAECVYMSVFVIGELMAGFRGGSRMTQNCEKLDAFLSKPTVAVLDASRETADVFGQIKNDLKTAGSPIPINDVWIAAHAMETGSVLVTYDAHFRKVPGIRLWDQMG